MASACALMIASPQLRRRGRGFPAEQVDGRRVDVAIGQVRERLVAGLFEPEVVGRRQQRGVGAVGLQRRGAAADVGADRDPLHVPDPQPVGAEQRDGVVIRRVADLPDGDALALELLRIREFFLRHQREQALVGRAARAARTTPRPSSRPPCPVRASDSPSPPGRSSASRCRPDARRTARSTSRPYFW